MDDLLRTQLWNFTYGYFLEPRLNRGGESFSDFYPIWTSLMNQDLDRFPGYDIVEVLKHWIKRGEWYEVYDLLEELIKIKTRKPAPGPSTGSWRSTSRVTA